MDLSAWLASINWMTALGWFVAPIISLKINQIIEEQVKIVTYSIAASNFFSDEYANRVGQSLGSKIQILIGIKLNNEVGMDWVRRSFEQFSTVKDAILPEL